MEQYYSGGKKGVGGSGSSRLDLIIHETASNNPTANPNNYHIGDIKTGNAVYRQSQMGRNANNVSGNAATNFVFSHWQFKPGEKQPTKK